MLQRVLEVRGIERREWNVLTELGRNRRPVIGKGDVSVSRSGAADVITPNPAAERKVPVPGGVLARLPGNGVWAVADDHLVGHLIVLRGVVVVIHRDPEDLAGSRHRLAVESLSYPTRPVDSG